MNFSKLTDNNQIIRNDFGCIHYLLCKISTHIIACNIFASYEFSKITIISMIISIVNQEPGCHYCVGVVLHIPVPTSAFPLGHCYRRTLFIRKKVYFIGPCSKLNNLVRLFIVNSDIYLDTCVLVLQLCSCSSINMFLHVHIVILNLFMSS